MKASTSLTLVLSLSASVALAGADPIAQCRQAHAGDPPAHIACLESALRDQSEATKTVEISNEAANVLGSEQIQQKQRASGEVSDQALSVSIVAVRYNSAGLGVFKFEDGQIWRETEESPQHLRLKPDQHYPAVIERGKVGGYRLQVEGIKRMLKIERLK